MKLRVKKKLKSRWVCSFRRRYVRGQGDHRRWWIEAILLKKTSLLEESGGEGPSHVSERTCPVCGQSPFPLSGEDTCWSCGCPTPEAVEASKARRQGEEKKT